MAMKKAFPHRRYTAEFKLEATRLSETVGSAEAARRLGLLEQNRYKWRKLKRDGQLATREGKAQVLKPGLSEAHAENDRLRRE